MRILIDIGHPAHVHYYRNMAIDLTKNGHTIIWTVKDIEVAKQLLDNYGFKYIVLPKKLDNLIGKIINQIRYDFIIFIICKREKIDVAIGPSASVAHVSKISTVKSIVFDDDDDCVQPLVAKFVIPFVDTLLSPDAIKNKPIGTILYPGYHELAYLHPKRFTPDPTVLEETGLTLNEPFFIMRFNVFKAHHDVGVKGLTVEQKLELVEILKPYGKIFITTEREIEPELKQYQLKISPEKIHSFMYFSSMFIGDSQTMTSEAAVLGVPALKCNSLSGKLSVPNEIENKFGLCFSYPPEQFSLLLEKINELLLTSDIKSVWQKRKEAMLKDKINVTSFYTWFIENYPNSIKEINTNPELFNQFK